MPCEGRESRGDTRERLPGCLGAWVPQAPLPVHAESLHTTHCLLCICSEAAGAEGTGGHPAPTVFLTRHPCFSAP